MKVWSRVIIGLGLVLAASPAAADILTVTYTGTVATGTDATGVFGLAGRSLAGLGYTVVYRFNDALGDRTTIPPYLDSVIGGSYDASTSPSMGALLTINGMSFFFNGLGQGLQSNFPLGGRISSSANDTALGNTFDASFVGESLATSDVPASMDTPYSASGTPAIDGFSNDFHIAYGPNGGITQNATGSLSPATVLVAVAAAVPESATWAMMIAGFGVVGYTMRRHRKISARVSYAG